MRQIIKNETLADDDWSVLRMDADSAPEHIAVPQGKIIVPLKVWLAQRAALRPRADVGVWFASDERAEDLGEDAAALPLIAVEFPKFADGRGYSIAHHLRSRLNYRGELRAIGDVLRDQMFYMRRVGFNAFATREDKDIHAALHGLNDFSTSYQASADEPRPLFRRVARGAA